MFADHIVELRDGGAPSPRTTGSAYAAATTRPRQRPPARVADKSLKMNRTTLIAAQ
jgi:hypothetical protein